MFSYWGYFKNCVLIWCCSLLLGCAEDVSNQSTVVKNDLLTLIAELELTPDSDASILLKTSTVSASARFAGDSAIKIRRGFESTINKLGYETSNTQQIGSIRHYQYCHKTVIGREIYVYNEVSGVVIGVRVSGWKKDREICRGKATEHGVISTQVQALSFV